MKTTKRDKWPVFAELPSPHGSDETSRPGRQVTGDRKKSAAREAHSCHVSPVTCHPSSAFTLIELLVVIGIIGVIAGFILVVAGPVKKKQYIFNTQAEMAKLETAIDRYKAAYGFYPPDNPGNPLTHQLYYELVGTIQTTNGGTLYYTTLNGSAPISASDVTNAFSGVGGFVNCTKSGAGEDSPAARNFLPDLKPNQMGTIKIGNVWVTNLISSVGGPYAQYQPLGQQDVNPWRYNSSNPTNNPGSYELWMQLVFAPGQTCLICNWTKQVQINSPLP